MFGTSETLDAPPPYIDLAGFLIDIDPMGVGLTNVVLPFLAGLIAYRHRGLGIVVFASLVLHFIFVQARLEYLVVRQPYPVKFPWAFAGWLLVWAVPSFIAGYLANALSRKIGSRRASIQRDEPRVSLEGSAR